MKLLLVYGTTDGQTRKIAAHLRDQLVSAGSGVTLIDVEDVDQSITLADYDAAIVAASIHIGKYQKSVLGFAQRNHEALNRLSSGFVSVSLSAAGREESDIQGLARCISEFELATGWKPALVHHAAGAFLYTKYGFIKRWLLKFIAWQHSAPTDTSRDHELTDWNALDQFAVTFLTRVVAG